MGPWLDTLDVPSKLVGLRPGWCKGFNLIVSRQFDARCGISLQGADGRLFFCVPRDGGTAIGTWYEPHPANSLPAQVSNEEIERFLRAINEAIGTEEITPSDVVGFDVGVLPTLHGSSASPMPLAHERISAHAGYIEVVSTKYTTFRSQARAVMQHI
jgi:glycerol-3-phosphate dehydrogenase